MEFAELKQIAVKTLNPKQYSDSIEAGGVAAALVTSTGNVYTGVCIDASCGIGFCAEHAAIAAMITAGESYVEKIVAVRWDGRVLPPCGRCREFLIQLGNMKTQVMVTDTEIATIKDLVPYSWQDEMPTR